eukprot:TRINITY_DN942_c0_g3_i7.p1 TRINITY_DN942_c0_g3~~TRINITY_DN942_c0_g3_i7.p1  ORF type:complete len:198 (+),score=48.88 TRINITY_DN942_c0_g3_i7:138-731(+)
MAARMVLRIVSRTAAHCNHRMQKRWKFSGREESHRLDRLEEVVSQYVKASAASSQRIDAAMAELAASSQRTDAAMAELAASSQRTAASFQRTDAAMAELAASSQRTAASFQRTDAAMAELAASSQRIDAAMAELAQSTASFNRKLEDYIGAESKISEIEMTGAAETCFQEDGFEDGTLAYSLENDSEPAAQPHVANT